MAEIKSIEKDIETKTKITSERLNNTFGALVLDGGFTSIPNTLLKYDSALGLTNTEFRFLIKLCSHILPHYSPRADGELWKVSTTVITDKMIEMKGSLTNTRRNLAKKGYIEIYKEFVNGKCHGSWYDLSGLFERIRNLVIEEKLKIKTLTENKDAGQMFFDFESEREETKTTEAKETQAAEKEKIKAWVIKQVPKKQNEIREERKKTDNKMLECFIKIWESEGEVWKDKYESEVAATLETHKPSESEIENVLKKLCGSTYPAPYKIRFLSDRIVCEIKKREKRKRQEEAKRINEARKAESQKEKQETEVKEFIEKMKTEYALCFENYGKSILEGIDNPALMTFSVFNQKYDSAYIASLDMDFIDEAKKLGMNESIVNAIKESVKKESMIKNSLILV